MNPRTKRKIRKLFSPIKRIGLKNKNFSIISNNCWGGVIYDIYGLQYLTPTVGCFMFSKDYLKFISNLEYYLSIDCIELKHSDSKYKDKLNANIPLGLVDDIEIVFLHYANIYDALDKWNRRRKRVNFKNLLVKYSDQNEFEKEDYVMFKKMMFDNSIFITGDSSLKIDDNDLYLPEFKEIGYAKDDIKPSFKYLNIKKLLNEIKR